MDDQHRLTYLTRYYYELQGIRTASLWLCLLVLQVRPDSLRSNGIAYDAFVWVALCFAFVCQWLASRYYRRRFGWLKPTWITLPTSRLYWSLYLGFGVWSFYCIIFSHFHGYWPYVYTLVWISPLFNAENPLLRRAYFGLAGLVVVSSALFLQIAHWDGGIIIVIQCLVLLALGVADHLLLMSLCTPPQEESNA